jgi:hypothetical protein
LPPAPREDTDWRPAKRPKPTDDAFTEGKGNDVIKSGEGSRCGGRLTSSSPCSQERNSRRQESSQTI